MCLSDKCLSQKNLDVGSKYIRKNSRTPKFHERVLAKAQEFINAIPESSSDMSQSFEFSNSFFDFQGLAGGKGETVRVHAIGRPLQDSGGNTPPSNIGNRQSTYQELVWEIGNEISFDQADLHMDDEGNIYIWYRWIGSSWTWKPVSKEEFSKLRGMEGV